MIKPEIYFYAFRYALGRMTHVPGEVCREITRHIDEIPKKMRDQMVLEINEAEEQHRLGMDIDAIEWRKLRTVLSTASDTQTHK